MEDDVVEGSDAVLQLALPVLVPEEPGVGKARAQHALVAGDDGLAAVRRLDVRDGDEAGGELAVRLQGREIFLVGAHRRGQHLRRHLHEPVVDGADDDHGPFDQPGDLGEQGGIVLDAQPGGRGGAGGALNDAPLTLRRIENDARRH